MRRSLISVLVAVLAIASTSASAQQRFDGWSVSVDWLNPANSFVLSGDTWKGHATGSLAGVSVGKGLQNGNFYLGLDGYLYGGVVETQEHGYAALNGLGGLTFKAGWVFWDRVLVYAGAGPDISLMTFGQNAQSTKIQFGSGAHVTLGVDVSVWKDVIIGVSATRRRLGDIANINVGDSNWYRLGAVYRF